MTNINSYLNNFITAKVTSAEIVEEKKEKHTEYRVEVARGDQRWAVSRRYSSFDSLYSKIKKVFPNLKLKFPKKKLFGNFDREFIRRRQIALNEFLQAATLDANIMKMPIMSEFLSIRDAINVSISEELEDLEAFNRETNASSKKSDNEDDTSKARSESNNINLGISNNPTAQPKDFEYLAVIGKGSFGKVYMARHKTEEKIYAIKILQKSAIKKRNEVKHIMAERNVLVKNIQHPFLVALYYSFQTNDKLYFVLDYVNGGERERMFAEPRAKFYAAEIAHAIGYLHQNDIIYRDLKPENILIDSKGHIKLTDFGLCKEGIQANTTTSTFCGTPEYLAPEVLLKKPYTRAIDWWCLGAVLYEMIFGWPPFYNKITTEMYNNILYNPLRMKPNMASPSAESIITGLLQKDQTARLGYSEEDFNELKTHSFFASINWDLLVEKKIDTPWKPNLSSEIDLKHIDPEFTREEVSASLDNSIDENEEKDQTFGGFTYVQESNVEAYAQKYLS